ncbi:hypothetical protein H4R19_001021, partial [Coemansia spiralis]
QAAARGRAWRGGRSRAGADGAGSAVQPERSGAGPGGAQGRAAGAGPDTPAGGHSRCHTGAAQAVEQAPGPGRRSRADHPEHSPLRVAVL